jgi:hypothetical protein
MTKILEKSLLTAGKSWNVFISRLFNARGKKPALHDADLNTLLLPFRRKCYVLIALIEILSGKSSQCGI